jgi:hypothetical protein
MGIPVAAMSRDQLMQIQASARVYQERADNALMPWDIRAPHPVLGEDIAKYRRDLAVMLKRQLPENHQLRKVQYRRLDDAMLSVFEPQLLKAVRDAANDPSTVPPGQMRRVVEVDEGGTKIVKWIGQRSFIEDLKAPAYRARIRTPDTHPGWFTNSARQAPAPIGHDQTGWHNAYRRFQVSQGYLEK